MNKPEVKLEISTPADLGLNELSKIIYQANVEKGFYDEDRKPIEALALVNCEICEAIEADRKGRHAKFLPENATNLDFEKCQKDTVEDEIADAIIRLLDFCGAYDIDIDLCVRQKLAYNVTRPYKHGKKY